MTPQKGPDGKRLKEPSSASQDLYRDFNKDLYINLNFTLFLKVFLMGPRGPQGLINYPQGPRGLKKNGARFFLKIQFLKIGARNFLKIQFFMNF